MGERLGRYLVIRPLATGGMGEILLAEHTGLSGFAKRVAVKRIRPDYARNSSYVELFLNEARVGSFLNHPNIVHIFDVGRDDDDLWLVMEYVDGVDLKRLLRRAKLAENPLAPPTIAAIIAQVLLALEEAHGGGPTRGAPIIHRDLSPENILIARSGSVKVLDFGLAKWSPGRTSVPSLEGKLIFGKTRYMPPEQLKGELIDARADLYALGVVLWEALAGRLPFGSGSASTVLAKVVAGPPPAPTAGLNTPDPALDAIVLKSLRPEADDRYQSAGQMREALVDYLMETNVHMPLECLRRMLKPGSPLAGANATRKAEHDGSAAARASTEIGLAVAKHCGKCGGSFSARFLDGLIADTCRECRGVWLDAAEITRILGEGKHRPEMEGEGFSRAPLDVVLGSCPTCKIGLRAFAVPDQPAAFEVCPACYGVWLDEGEFELLRNDDVVTWFRTLLDALRSLA